MSGEPPPPEPELPREALAPAPPAGEAAAVRELRRTIAGRDALIRDLREENGRRNSRLIEKDALILQLEDRLLSQQRQLDDTIQEVVRVKAKQRSLESRAEAASEMAEAEIALKSLRVKAATSYRSELLKAEQLLEMAATEFEDQNFGGALYLIGQAKSQIRMGSLKLHEGPEEGNGGELALAVPISVTVTKRSNLRDGPGREFKVLVTLDPGTLVTGYSTKGSWLRVETGEGRSGWIHLSLVSRA